MSSGYYVPGEQRAAKVRSLFSRVASRYDLLNDLQSFGLHRHWKQRLISMARPQKGESALDVCCGTGDIALGLGRKGVRATGVDFTERMLEEAKQRAQSAGAVGNVQFLLGDAQSLPFPENAFEIVTIGYGLRNLADWELGLREMNRVAKPRGRLLVLEFGKPENPLWRALYFAYLRLFVPVLGLLFCGDAQAYSYILESLKHYPCEVAVARKMEELGLVNVQIKNLLSGAMSINYGERPA